MLIVFPMVGELEGYSLVNIHSTLLLYNLTSFAGTITFEFSRLQLHLSYWLSAEWFRWGSSWTDRLTDLLTIVHSILARVVFRSNLTSGLLVSGWYVRLDEQDNNWVHVWVTSWNRFIAYMNELRLTSAYGFWTSVWIETLCGRRIYIDDSCLDFESIIGSCRPACFTKII